MNLPKVFVAIPNLGNIRTELVLWLLDCANNFNHHDIPINGVINLNVDRPIEVNRNIIANEFLKTDCTHLLMIDSDVSALPNLIPDWLRHDRDIIGGYIPIWNKELQHPRFFAYNIIDGKPVYINPKIGFQKCDIVGTGAIMFKRKVIETIPNPRFRQILDNDGRFKMGEDQYFVGLARNAGFEIYVDPRPMDQRTNVNLIETIQNKVKN